MPDHESYMDRAIELACQNLKRPFGSVIVDSTTGEVIAEGLNKNYTNPVLHSDIAAINAVASEYEDHQWGNYALYTTAEPNAMCMSAILWAGIPKVYYGTSLERLGELGFRQIDIPAQEVVDRARNLHCELVGGIKGEACDKLFSAASQLDKQTSPA